MCALQLALGGLHTCARKHDGTLWCWGDNGSGQLGDGTMVGKSSPGQVTSLGAAVVEVALGSSHTCARKQDGTLWCWGSNGSGELGDGTKMSKSSPVQVTSLGSSVVGVAMGYEYTCARKQDGTLWCWGNNLAGKLGDGTEVNKSAPVQVAGLGAAVAEVALGYHHTCARKQDGTLWCWGRNLFGQVGDGTTTDKHNPVQVPLLASVVEVSLGYGHTCARKQNGSLWCWGLNQDGQLGIGSGLQKDSPVQVAALGTAVIEVVLGGWRTCTRKQDGTLWCWGQGGVLGDGTPTGYSTPTQASTFGTDVVEVALGDGHMCVRKQDGTPWCWGENYNGQLGDGTTVNKLTATEVPLCP